MSDEEEPGGGIPEWVVTFGDMMSLLLTFFIMLVSLSEIKEDEEKYQTVASSIRRRFGHEMSSASSVPGNLPPSNSDFENIATMGRASRFSTESGGDKVRAPVGDFPQVRIVRPGSQVAVGTAITFPPESAELLEVHREAMVVLLEDLAGKPQKIEVRGHTSAVPLGEESPYADHHALAYDRAREVRDHLVTLGVDSRRIRISVAGSHEPIHEGVDPVQLVLNSRVEIFLLDELTDFTGGQGFSEAEATETEQEE